MSPVRICTVCEDPILKGEPSMTISGQPLHKYCDISPAGGVCDDERCHWWRTDHAGTCTT